MKQINMKHDEATNTAVEKLFTMGELEQEEPAAPMRQQSWDKLIREERVMKVDIQAMVENIKLVVNTRMTEEQRVVTVVLPL